jgi:hypothetical protein
MPFYDVICGYVPFDYLQFNDLTTFMAFCAFCNFKH